MQDAHTNEDSTRGRSCDTTIAETVSAGQLRVPDHLGLSAEVALPDGSMHRGRLIRTPSSTNYTRPPQWWIGGPTGLRRLDQGDTVQLGVPDALPFLAYRGRTQRF